MTLSLSTSFIASELDDSRQLVKILKHLGVHAVELEYRLKSKLFQELKATLRSERITVTSLHNYCPFPGIIPKARPSGDYFRLSSPDAEERKLAVQWTAKTIQQAHELEASTVVLHCGAVAMDSYHADIYKLCCKDGKQSDEFNALLKTNIEQRENKKAPFINALLFSLDQLLNIADKYQILLGIENRYHYLELPDLNETAFLLKKFEGGPIGYWHDTGHGHVREQLGLGRQQQWLERFAQKLVGMHVHDAKGFKDHLAPGTGNIDFSKLLPKSDSNYPVVLELAPGTGIKDIEAGVNYLRNILATCRKGPLD
ncbi:MAG: sugar phosphate isomerase/epimerase [Desulfobacteraceae bacterium]|nr:sugar phosphate isomerase/epimerase [Desulfobacteraceae bacterium]